MKKDALVDTYQTFPDHKKINNFFFNNYAFSGIMNVMNNNLSYNIKNIHIASNYYLGDFSYSLC